MIKITNKSESLKFIKNNKLNHFGEINFKRNDYDGVIDFIKEYDVNYYFLRELKPATKNVFYTLTKEEVLKHVSSYDTFGLDVSSENYKDNIKLVGEISYCANNDFMFSGSTNITSTHRYFKEPNYFLKTDVFDKKIKNIPYIDKIIRYIDEHNLYNLIIEFVVFDIPIGINKEEIVVYEVRTDY